jgi:hypothetical protein
MLEISLDKDGLITTGTMTSATPIVLIIRNAYSGERSQGSGWVSVAGSGFSIGQVSSFQFHCPYRETRDATQVKGSKHYYMLMCYTQIFLFGPALTSSRCYFEDQILETDLETSLTFRIDIRRFDCQSFCGTISQ